MKNLAILIIIAALPHTHLLADEDTPVPPEVQKLVETFVTALKSADQAALSACWHSPQSLGKLKAASVSTEAATAPTPLDPAREEAKEVKKQTRNIEVTLTRAGQLQAIIGKRFGDINQLKLTRVELDVDGNATAGSPAYDSVEILLLAADGTALKIKTDDAVQIGGVWKFVGRLDDNLTIGLPDSD